MHNETTQKIIEYYDGRVTQYGLSGKSTLLDDNMRILEIETVNSWLSPTDKVLDIFCGNGVSTVEFAKHCESIVGLDLSQKMIEAARERLAQDKSLPTNISFENGNVLELHNKFSEGQFNTVVSVRGLINLPSLELQKEAITSVHKMLPSGGKLIFLEGSRDGLEKINQLRTQFELPPIKEPWYDKFFEIRELLEFMSPLFDTQATRSLDPYFLVSRILYPLAAKPEEAQFENICNKVARLIVPYVKTDENTTLLICKCFVKK